MIDSLSFWAQNQKVVKGNANLTVGAYSRSAERNKLLSPSEPYFYTSIGFIYKEGHRQLNAMAAIVTPFDATVWLALHLILYLTVLIILLTKTMTRKWRHFVIGGRINRAPILNAWAIILGHPIHNPVIVNGRAFGHFSRTLTIVWVGFWFLIRCHYEGALYNYMQGYQPSPRYDTVQKVLTSNCKVILSLNGINTLKFYMKENR